jgi:TetR/AcrR family fatty acid metabolism transcriptional regulator
MLIDRILIEGIEKGEFSGSLDIRLARQMIFGTIDETVTSWVMNDLKFDLPSQAEKVHRLLICGCGK